MMILLASFKSTHNSWVYSESASCINERLRCGISLKNASNALELVNNSVASFMQHLACQSTWESPSWSHTNLEGFRRQQLQREVLRALVVVHPPVFTSASAKLRNVRSCFVKGKEPLSLTQSVWVTPFSPHYPHFNP